MVLIEATSVGLPVVATAVGGVREILEDGVNGVLVTRSLESLSDALERLYESPELMCRLGRASRAKHEESFEIGKVVAMYHSVYSESSDSRRPGC